ncbi:hypothetical protein EMPS_05243 [Entomortierella parvispora]|uniref:IPT/TIG domain-containing protein n=1 Tax=Entomortierella parvispora TaxID=205924 RepID=A0A9P3HA24_9FUNG|nr:hypothetical protein EMPS_05243 [Entomortierella parvispora]
MPPYSSTANPAIHLTMGLNHGSFESTFIHQQESSAIRMGDSRKAQLATPEWNSAQLYSVDGSLESYSKPATSHRLNVKTHVFKKELQEYVPTQIEDRLRIETIIYVELSIVSQEDGSVLKTYDYARLPKDLFFAQADKVMSEEEMATKNILNLSTILQCPSNNWQEETEACLRCAKRMSAKLEQTESRILHLLPELHRTEDGDALISFRSGVANIQFKVNCYCGHKKEKEGFVIRFDSLSDASIASHVTLPLMFYHQNKNRIASRAAAAAAKAAAKAEQLQLKLQQQELKKQQKLQRASSSPRNVVKSSTSKSKRERSERSESGSPLGSRPQHQFPTPPGSQLNSPIDYPSQRDLDDFMDSSPDVSYMSHAPPDPMISLFPELTEETPSPQHQVQQQIQPQHQEPQTAAITHLTPSSGPTRGGTLVTIHGSGFTVGEMMYVCFGQTFVPIIPQRDHMLECFTPAAAKAETVSVFALHTTVPTTVPAQASYTYVDDNEKELIKLALQRLMSISARLDGPLDSVLSRANEFTLWNDLLEGTYSSTSASSSSTPMPKPVSFSNLEKMVLESFKLVDDSMVSSTSSPIVMKSKEGLDITNETGHTMLHLSVALQYESLVRDLILRGVDLKLRDKNGLSALALAQRLGLKSMVDLLSSAEINNHGSRALVWSEDSSSLDTTTHGKVSTTKTSDHHQRMDFEWEDFGANASSSSSKIHDLATRRPNIGPLREVVELQTLLPSTKSDTQTMPLRGSSGILRNNIQATGLMDVSSHPPGSLLNVRDTTAVDVLGHQGDPPVVVATRNHPLQHVSLLAEASSCNEVVVARGSGDEAEVVGRDCVSQGEDGTRTLLREAVERAGVQTGRTEEDSEPVLLFLGGRPVVMTRHSRTSASSTPSAAPQEAQANDNGCKDQNNDTTQDDSEITHP